MLEYKVGEVERAVVFGLLLSALLGVLDVMFVEG